MPITKELYNIKKLEAVGFPHEQAETLTDIIEQSHVDSQQSLKEFIHNEITNLETRLKLSQAELETRLKSSQAEMAHALKSSQAEMAHALKTSQAEMAHALKSSQAEMGHGLKSSQTEMELRLKTSQTDIFIKFSAVVAGFISAALAIAKLLW